MFKDLSYSVRTGRISLKMEEIKQRQEQKRLFSNVAPGERPRWDRDPVRFLPTAGDLPTLPSGALL